MNKKGLFLFDLDGVLVSTKEIHYNALNEALQEICPDKKINYENHLNNFDGLPTKEKLKKINIPDNLHNLINKIKQSKTYQHIDTEIKPDDYLKYLLIQAKINGFDIGVVSNAIRKTIDLVLKKLGIEDCIDIVVSNEDTRLNKPHCSPYLYAMMRMGYSPDETIIFEDSYIGAISAFSSGAHVEWIEKPGGYLYQRIHEAILRKKINKNHQWDGSGMNILIPMAGAGSRFKAMGYEKPKPLIDINIGNGFQKLMIQTVIDNISIKNANYTYLVLEEHYKKYNLETILKLITPGNCNVIVVDKITEGAACTALLAKKLINNEQPLLIVNSDQYVEWDPIKTMINIQRDQYDAAIFTFSDDNPKWSYAKLDCNGYVCEVAEKNPISNNATCGIYYYKHGKDFVRSAELMIDKNIRTNNEFYICPAFNEFINELGKKPVIIPVEKMWGLGTPEDLQYFEENRT